MAVQGRMKWFSLSLLFFLSLGCAPSTPTSTMPDSRLLGGHWTLVNFGAPWCAVCRKLEPELAHFEKEQPNVRYQHVNVEAKHTSEFKNYFSKYFHGRAIPFTVLIDSEGRARKDWSGYLTYQEIVSDILEVETNMAKEQHH